MALTSIATMHGKGSDRPKKKMLALFKETKKKLRGDASPLPDVFSMTRGN